MHSHKNFEIVSGLQDSSEIVGDGIFEEFTNTLDMFLGQRPEPLGWFDGTVLALRGLILAAALMIGILQNQAGIMCSR